MEKAVAANERSQEIYSSFAIEPIEYIEKNKLGFHEGAIIKYVTRYPLNGGAEDLKKARWFLDRLIEQARDPREEPAALPLIADGHRHLFDAPEYCPMGVVNDDWVRFSDGTVRKINQAAGGLCSDPRCDLCYVQD
jgi:hypothetical protein